MKSFLLVQNIHDFNGRCVSLTLSTEQPPQQFVLTPRRCHLPKWRQRYLYKFKIITIIVIESDTTFRNRCLRDEIFTSRNIYIPRDRGTSRGAKTGHHNQWASNIKDSESKVSNLLSFQFYTIETKLRLTSDNRRKLQLNKNLPLLNKGAIVQNIIILTTV